MTAEHKPLTKRFTRADAHKALPLVNSIVRDMERASTEIVNLLANRPAA